jgi:orotate phosphoribosyltransferase
VKSSQPSQAEIFLSKAVVYGKVICHQEAKKSGLLRQDLRRITLDSNAAPLVGAVALELTKDWDYEAVGGLNFRG